VIWIWDEADACCQPGQPSVKQAPSAAAKPGEKKEGKPPIPPPVAPPPKPPVPKDGAAPPAAEPELKDIETTLRARGGLEKLLAAAKIARVLEELAAGGPFTVFAPTDEAFAKLDPLVLERLLANPDALNDLLLYHAFAGKLTADEAVQRGSAKTTQGSDVRFGRDGSRRLVNDAVITDADIACTNGVVHVIDRVLFPPGFEMPAAAAPAKPPADAPAAKPAAEGQPSRPKAP